MNVIKILSAVINITGDQFVSNQEENTVKHFQDEIKFVGEEVGNKNEIIKTSLENTKNFLKNNFLKIKVPLIILIKKNLKRQNQKIESQVESSFITPTKNQNQIKRTSIKVMKQITLIL